MIKIIIRILSKIKYYLLKLSYKKFKKDHIFKINLDDKPQIVFEIHKPFYKNENVYPDLINKLIRKGYTIKEIAGNCLAY